MHSKTLAQIAHCCEDWGFFQLINHGVSEDLLERVKKVASECYKFEREPGFENSKPVNLLKDLVEKKTDESLVESVDWEDVFLLSDENHEEWPSKTPGFRFGGLCVSGMNVIWIILSWLLSFGGVSNGLSANASSRPKMVSVGAIFALDSTIGKVAKFAIEEAVKDVNANSSVLSGGNECE